MPKDEWRRMRQAATARNAKSSKSAYYFSATKPRVASNLIKGQRTLSKGSVLLVRRFRHDPYTPIALTRSLTAFLNGSRHQLMKNGWEINSCPEPFQSRMQSPLWIDAVQVALRDKGCCKFCGSTDGLHGLPVSFKMNKPVDASSIVVICESCQSRIEKNIGR